MSRSSAVAVVTLKRLDLLDLDDCSDWIEGEVLPVLVRDRGKNLLKEEDRSLAKSLAISLRELVRVRSLIELDGLIVGDELVDLEPLALW
jgi:hypothetical protein